MDASDRILQIGERPLSNTVRLVPSNGRMHVVSDLRFPDGDSPTAVICEIQDWNWTLTDLGSTCMRVGFERDIDDLLKACDNELPVVMRDHGLHWSGGCLAKVVLGGEITAEQCEGYIEGLLAVHDLLDSADRMAGGERAGDARRSDVLQEKGVVPS